MLHSNTVGNMGAGRFQFDLFYAGMIIMAASLPFSNFLMSISQFIMAAAWLMEGRIGEKVSRFIKNAPAVLFSSLFIIHLIGLLYTSDMDYGVEDVRKKLPIFIIPFLLASRNPLPERKLEILYKIFISAVLTGTLISTVILLDWTGKHVFKAKDSYTFISPIRFSLMTCLSVFLLAKDLCSRKVHIPVKIIILLLISWLICYMAIMQFITALVCLIFSTFVLSVWYALRLRKIVVRVVVIGMALALPVGTFFYISSEIKRFYTVVDIDLNRLDAVSPYGEKYQHDVHRQQYENGYLVWIYLAPRELEAEWNNRSAIKYHQKDRQGNELKYTLIRYLASKGLRKDRDGMNKLSGEDISSIERGIPNFRIKKRTGLKKKIREIIWELDNYKRGGNPSNHSVAQRFEFWKAAIGIIREHPLFGVGTGDAKKAYRVAYKKMGSLLEEKQQLRAHNQFLAISVALGIIGLLWFVLVLAYPLRDRKMRVDYLYITFFFTIVLSMIPEDTLETQAGVSFFIFFNCIFLFCRKY